MNVALFNNRLFSHTSAKHHTKREWADHPKSFIDTNLHRIYAALLYFDEKRMAFFPYKMRYQNMLTLPQNGGNHISEDLKFQQFPGTAFEWFYLTREIAR